MVLPTNISSTYVPTVKQGGTKPFRAGDGDIFVILTPTNCSIDIVQDGDLLHIAAQMQSTQNTSFSPRAFKATDPTSSWSAVDTTGEPTWQTDTDDTEVWYSRFNMASETWVEVATSDKDILVDDVQDSITQWAVNILLRSDGDLLIIYQGFRDKFMGTDRARVAFAFSSDNGQTWTTDQGLSPTGEATIHYVGASVIPPNNSDQAHVFYNAEGTLETRAIDNANSPQTNERSTGFACASTHSIKRAIAFDRSGALVKCLYIDSSGNPEVYSMTPYTGNGDPTATDSSTQIVTETVGNQSNNWFADLVFDPGTNTVHEIHHDASTDDTQHHDDQATNTWQDNGNIYTGTFTTVAPSMNIYDRDGAKIGFVARDVATGQTVYDEIDVTPSTTALSAVDMGAGLGPGQNSYHGPFEISSDFYAILLTGNSHDIVAVRATPASPVDGDWDSSDTPIRISTKYIGPSGEAPGDLTQDPIRSIWALEDSSDLHVVTQQESGRIAYHVYDPGTLAWTIRDEHIAKTGDTNFGSAAPPIPAASLGRRSDGDVVVVAAYDDAGDETFRVFTREGTTWTNRGEATAGVASTDYRGVAVIPRDSSDRITWACKDHTNNDVDLRSIDSSNTLSSVTEVDADVDLADLVVAPGVINSSNVIYLPYIDADNQISAGSWTSGASPTVSVDDTVGDNSVYGNGRASAPYCAACLAIDGSNNVHLVYVAEGDGDIYYDGAVASGGETDSKIATAAGFAWRVSCRVNADDSAVLVLYSDSGTTTFFSHSLAAGPTSFIVQKRSMMKALIVRSIPFILGLISSFFTKGF